MPITPKGTEILDIFIPLGRSVSIIIFPKGEGKLATLRISDAMPSILSSVNKSLSYKGFERSILDKSSAFASKI